MITPTCSKYGHFSGGIYVLYTYILAYKYVHTFTIYSILYRCSTTLNSSSHDMTRETELSMLRKNNLIGAHYASHMHTFEKLMIPKHSGPTVPLDDVAKERSTTKTAFSQESIAHLQTAFMVYCFPSCPLWILSKFSWRHDRVCYADAGQMLFKTLRP